MLANAVALTVINYLEMAVVLVILGVPAIIAGAIIPIVAIRTLLGILVLVGVWMFKLAVSDAYAMAATLLAYHRATEQMEPNPDWKERLTGISDEFRNLCDRAANAVSGQESDANNQTDETGQQP